MVQAGVGIHGEGFQPRCVTMYLTELPVRAGLTGAVNACLLHR